jgi:hypothetical protein
VALAYTPGLKVKALTTIRKTRRLPIRGDILVKKGDTVKYGTIVAQTRIPGNVEVLDVAHILGIESADLEIHMLKKVGEPVEKDELIAKYVAFFGLSKIFVNSPIKGTVERVSILTGQVTIREEPINVSIDAYIPGAVADLIPGEGVVIETRGSLIQGILGVGGETHGEIKIAVKSPDEVLTQDKITPDSSGKIVVGGALVTSDALKRAVLLGVKGIVVGGVEDKDLVDFLGYEIGVAITGHEQVGLTLIVTEGFGKMQMSNKTFALLKSSESKLACINGATQLRAGVTRPEIIIPGQDTEPTATIQDEGKEIFKEGMHQGMLVRIIRQPHFGAIGKISALPVPLEKIRTESHVRVLEVELEDGRTVMVPRANVEIIEE